MASAIWKETIQSVRTCLVDRDPVAFGVCTVPAQDFGLFYGKGDTARQLHLRTASDAELEHLARACTAATFGINQQDVYDETYRKAGKMDVEEFASKFDLERSGILTHIKDGLLDHTNYGRPVDWELHKLNVYGSGGFFKAHKDTPRGAYMFGSLVVVFPTKHTGGELKLRHGGKEWTFDSAKELAAATEPSIGYIAFFSDVEHEVTVVQSGYRVTLTFNLYFGGTPSPSKALNNLDINRENAFRTRLAKLLADPKFLPKGGWIGFGLQHEYPVNANTDLRTLMERLEGSDALVKKVGEQLSLPIQPKMMTQKGGYYVGDYYHEDDYSRKNYADDPDFLAVLTDHVVDLSKYGDALRNGVRVLKKEEGALILPYPDGTAVKRWDAGKKKRVKCSIDIRWITKSTLYNKVKTTYIAYNKVNIKFRGYRDFYTVGYLYGTVCFAANIGPAGKRINKSKAVPDE
ncbi:uncharacterized protein LOC129585582 [Paramacrobiotus metropolitanus]|uniref:uncharacterized protein LOC129585582 n=1 Tax=Paramacrobiotus metropolitanus TaxID=2943436 RepID=UPI0024464B3D|nr:uncharacterized protein LOC129585582 [Paramacrobiotus metropolitanus]